MDNTPVQLHIDMPQANVLRLVLSRDSHVLQTVDVEIQGHVDNILLTAVDNLLGKNSIDKSALQKVTVGSGIDKNSSSYRIVTSFASAVQATRKGPKIGQK